MTSAWRGGLGRLALLLASLAFVLGAAERVFRSLGYVPLYEIYSKPELFWRHDERLGWSLELHARGRYTGPRPFPIEYETTIEISSLGLRGPELGPREPGELRVLASAIPSSPGSRSSSRRPSSRCSRDDSRAGSASRCARATPPSCS